MLLKEAFNLLFFSQQQKFNDSDYSITLAARRCDGISHSFDDPWSAEATKEQNKYDVRTPCDLDFADDEEEENCDILASIEDDSYLELQLNRRGRRMKNQSIMLIRAPDDG